MKNVIYQYWDGPMNPCIEYSKEQFKNYADKIGCDYIFEHNPKYVSNLGKYSPHYGAFKPVFESSFDKYDNVMFVDSDVFPVNNIEENIFSEFAASEKEIGICEEWNAPKVRTKYTIAGINNSNDEKWVKVIEDKWGVTLPRTKEGLPSVFNSGMVLYSKSGRDKAKKSFVNFSEYVKLISKSGLPAFYTCDQPYIHAMLEVCKFDWITMDYKWNSSVHYQPSTPAPRPVVDLRKQDTNFVHIQLSGKYKLNKSQLNMVVNLPTSMWSL